MRLQNNVYVALLTAVSVIIGLVENMFPSPFAFAPGAKIGFANLIILIAVFTLRKRDVWLILVLKLFTTALFTGFSVFLYSTAGGVLSLIAMYLVKAIGWRYVSLIGVSVAGGFFHNAGQLLVASWIAQTPAVLLYLPWLAFFGILAGLFNGYVGNILLVKIKPIYHLFQKTNSNWMIS